MADDTRTMLPSAMVAYGRSGFNIYATGRRVAYRKHYANQKRSLLLSEPHPKFHAGGCMWSTGSSFDQTAFGWRLRWGQGFLVSG